VEPPLKGIWKIFPCHETVMAFPYQVVYYHRQLEIGKVFWMATCNEDSKQERRKAAMNVLAHSAAAEIAGRIETVVLPAHESLRAPEYGLVMVRGRIGGDGAPFNLGEATVSRAAVRLASGEVGFGYVLGRDSDKARMIALCDALVQSPDHASTIEAQVVAPLRAAMAARRDQKAAEAAATRVEFYTMVRGEG
jgi:alpha-D-ribose 1-methylphosphonate 5-triphosphate synthase subunit PhnG